MEVTTLVWRQRREWCAGRRGAAAGVTTAAAQAAGAPPPSEVGGGWAGGRGPTPKWPCRHPPLPPPTYPQQGPSSGVGGGWRALRGRRTHHRPAGSGGPHPPRPPTQNTPCRGWWDRNLGRRFAREAGGGKNLGGGEGGGGGGAAPAAIFGCRTSAGLAGGVRGSGWMGDAASVATRGQARGR